MNFESNTSLHSCQLKFSAFELNSALRRTLVNRVLFDTSLSTNGRVIMLMIIDACSDRTLRVQVSKHRLAERVGLSKRTVDRAIDRLEELGSLKVDRVKIERKRNEINTYTVIPSKLGVRHRDRARRRQVLQ